MATTYAALTIGEVSARTGLGVHTLRLYEREGLLLSEVARDAGGRRAYSEDDVAWLVNCSLFRAAGMPLATLAQLASLVRSGPGNETERLELLRAHRARIEAQLVDLHACLALVDRKTAAYEAHLTAGGSGDPW